ncbi:DUF1289 domain-containing protein [Burkholderia sp. Ax-1719]|uniref:DUF1289 domain-containing protein n=1 Tax=Burkholderia sp. Ax-1719 TaxID=2608334 RepID=UPI00141F7344|nr:DUF1289 domain-containing protein [Burkholderia sp. Ax-1719]NIE66746.1 DUF1289 domain-containing protein [Burkholderia sp. Ax-1719]
MSRCAKRNGMTTPSPCINVCRMHEASGLCEGCLRTIDEIASWSTLDDDAKRAVWDAIEVRHAQWLTKRNASNVAHATDKAKPGDAR